MKYVRRRLVVAVAVMITALSLTTAHAEALRTPAAGVWHRHSNYPNPAWDISLPGQADCGNLVRSTRSGRARVRHWFYSYGKHVQVGDSLYAHLSRTRVRQGQWVRAGQVVGNVGQTGNAYGCHLHYEVGR